MRHPLLLLALPLTACGALSGGTIPPALTSFPDPGVTLVTDQDVDPATLEHFSFFVTSLASMQLLTGRETGFGGDLRYGETGPGAGLRGADRICATIAERSLAGASAKGWRAFLSATDDGSGHQVDAIDRVGAGPWYDRLGRLVAQNPAELASDRPVSAQAAIHEDLPNEDGVPNHAPDPTQGQVDNHRTLTGSNSSGRLYSATATCLDWTSAMGDPSIEGQPRVGHSWVKDDAGHGGPGGNHPPKPGKEPKDGGPQHWISSMDEAGCGAGVNLQDGHPTSSLATVGSGGGYGGLYCFALYP